MEIKKAIDILKDFNKQVTVKSDGVYQTDDEKAACETAIKSLEELEDYHRIGTLRNLQINIGRFEKKKPLFNQGWLELVSEYIKEPWLASERYMCPSCGGILWKDSKDEYCRHCGQAIDWR